MKQDIYDLTVEHILDNQDKAYRLAYSYVQDRDAALDVVQNAACQALEKCWGVKNPSALKTWHYKIVVNEALQYLRKNRREISTQPEDMKEEAQHIVRSQDGLSGRPASWKSKRSEINN